MRFLRARVRRDERGASLILAIVFMLVAGAIGAGLTTSVSSGVLGSHVLTVARDREYAAEGGINRAIAALRAGSPASIGLIGCGPFNYDGLAVEGSTTVDIRVECTPAPEVTASPNPSVRHNVILVACEAVGNTACGGTGKSAPIIRSQINFQVSAADAVTSTYVQTWSVSK